MWKKCIVKSIVIFLLFYPTSLICGDEIQVVEGKVRKSNDFTYYDYLLSPSHSSPREEPIRYVMVHFMSNAKEKPHNPYALQDIIHIFKKYRLSSHYLIARNGAIYRLVPESRIAYHAGSNLHFGISSFGNTMNAQSIGVELMAIGTKEEMTPLLDEKTYDFIDLTNIGYTDEQYTALNRLLLDLYCRYPNLRENRDFIIGHNEYAPMRKVDPGRLFEWSRIRDFPRECLYTG